MGYFDKKNNWLLLLMIVLNLGLVGSMFFKPRPPHPHQDIVSQLQKKLTLTDEQTQQFKQFREENFDKIIPTHEEIRRKKQEMIQALGQEIPDTIRAKQLATEIGQHHQYIEEELIKHYLELKEVCTPEQQQLLNGLFLEAMKPKGPPPGKRRK